MADMENTTGQSDKEQNNAEPSGTNGKEPKSFTQEEVDRIVQDRLARERKKHQPSEPDPLEEREQALAKREAAMGVKELLKTEGHPMELADILDYKDLDDFKKKYEALKEFLVNPNAPTIQFTKRLNQGGSMYEDTADEKLRKAMKLR